MSTFNKVFTPFFSIVIPAYNAGITIENTFQSVLAQDFPDYEIVVVNDGSTDNTGDLADMFAQQNAQVRAIHQENGGSGAAINSGINASLGRYVCICSSDDKLSSDCLQVQYQAIVQHPDFQLFTTAGYHFNVEEGWEKSFFDTREWKYSHEITLERLLELRFFGSGIVFDREAALAAGGYAVSVYAEDFDFYLRMLLQGNRMWFTNMKCVYQQVSMTQKSANAALIKESVLTSIDTALACDSLDDGQREALIRGRQKAEEHLSINEGMLAQKMKLDRVIEWLPGKRLQVSALKATRALSPIVRPVRRVIAGRGYREDSGG